MCSYVIVSGATSPPHVVNAVPGWPPNFRPGRKCAHGLFVFQADEIKRRRSASRIWLLKLCLAVAVLSNEPLDDYDECYEGDQSKHIDHGNAFPS
jgi:hypothetical protein